MGIPPRQIAGPWAALPPNLYVECLCMSVWQHRRKRLHKEPSRWDRTRRVLRALWTRRAARHRVASVIRSANVKRALASRPELALDACPMTDSVAAQVHGHKACAGCRIVTASTALLSRDIGRRPAAGRVKLSLITAASVQAMLSRKR